MRLTELKGGGEGYLADLTAIADKISANCQPYLKAIHYDIVTYPLWRGTPKTLKADLSIIKCPIDRTPRNTATEFHIAADNWMASMSGVRFRSNAIFATGNLHGAETYGSDVSGGEYLMFPIGKFQFCWSRNFKDLFDIYECKFQAPDIRDFVDPDIEVPYGDWDELKELPGYEDYEAAYGDAVNDIMDAGDYEFGHDLEKAITSGHEIMFHCEAAFLLNGEYYDNIDDLATLMDPNYKAGVHK